MSSSSQLSSHKCVVPAPLPAVFTSSSVGQSVWVAGSWLAIAAAAAAADDDDDDVF